MAFLKEPTPQDVANRIEHDFAPHERERVASILARAKHYSSSDVSWRQLAALRAANGHVELVQQWIDLGNTDYRDLILAINGIAGEGWERDYILYGKRS